MSLWRCRVRNELMETKRRVPGISAVKRKKHFMNPLQKVNTET
jgi:hypothetical protein